MRNVRMAVVVGATAMLLMGADGGCFGSSDDGDGSGGSGAGGSGGSGQAGPCKAYCTNSATQCSNGSAQAIALCTDECDSSLAAYVGCEDEFKAYLACMASTNPLDCTGETFDCPDELAAVSACEGGGS